MQKVSQFLGEKVTSSWHAPWFVRNVTFDYVAHFSDTVAARNHCACGLARVKQGEERRICDVVSWDIECLEHNLSRLFTLRFVPRGSKRFSAEDGVLFGGNTALIVEGVVPYLLHVIPVGDNTMAP